MIRDPVRARAAALDLASRQHQRTAPEVHEVMDLWEFERGTKLDLFLVRPARVRWHLLCPEAERTIVVVDDGFVEEQKVLILLDIISVVAVAEGIGLEEG